MELQSGSIILFLEARVQVPVQVPVGLQATSWHGMSYAGTHANPCQNFLKSPDTFLN